LSRKSLNFGVPCAAFLEHWCHSSPKKSYRLYHERQKETSGGKPIKKPKASDKDDMSTMGNVWENRLSKEDYQVLDKALTRCLKIIARQST
jgi:hypothetical protein